MKKRDGPLPNRFGISKKKKSTSSIRIVPAALDSEGGLGSLFRSVVLRPLSHAPVKDSRTARTRATRSREDSEEPVHGVDLFFEGGGVRPSRPVFRQSTQEELCAAARPLVLQQYLKHASDSQARVVARLQSWCSGARSPQATCEACALGTHRVKVISLEGTFIATVPAVSCTECGVLCPCQTLTLIPVTPPDRRPCCLWAQLTTLTHVSQVHMRSPMQVMR